MVDDNDAMMAPSEYHRAGSQSAPPGSGPSAWQLMLWRFLAVVASTPDERSSMAFERYLRRHPFRGAAYLVAAWVLALELVAVLATVLLERLHLRPRGAADFGVTVLALFGIFALLSAAGRRLGATVAARVNRWRTGRPLER